MYLRDSLFDSTKKMVKRPKARRFVVEKYACCCGNGDTIYSIILYHIIVYHGVVYSYIYYIGICTQAQRGLLSMCSHIVVKRTNTKKYGHIVLLHSLQLALPLAKTGGARYG